MRVTKRNLEDRIENINCELLDVKLELGGRYGYFAVDVFCKYKHHMIETLKTGSKKECGIYLKGFSNALNHKKYLREEK